MCTRAQAPPIRKVPAKPASNPSPAGETGGAEGEVVVVDENGKELGKAPPPARQKSRAWKFMSERYVSKTTGRVVTNCLICGEQLVACNTTNLLQHVQRKHKNDYIKDLAGEEVRPRFSLRHLLATTTASFHGPSCYY